MGEAAAEVGASSLEGAPSRRIIVGTTAPLPDAGRSIAAWCDGWRAGTAEAGTVAWGDGHNPLSGIAAGALAVGKAFESERGFHPELRTEISLWPMAQSDQEMPHFADVFLPGALWLIGLGNLGQAYLWALASLPYADPAAVSLVLQDRDKVTEENWATSVLVHDETYGSLKTKVGERWASAKGFDVKRLDRRLLASDRLDDDDPRVALSGVDRIESRKVMEAIGFDCIVDAGLGRTSKDFDRYRVTVFDQAYPIHKHFAEQTDQLADGLIPDDEVYRRLEAEVGRCGTAEVAGASVAAPYVSAIAATVAVSRLIAVASGCACSRNEVGRISNLDSRKLAPAARIRGRGIRHAGKPISQRMRFI